MARLNDESQELYLGHMEFTLLRFDMSMSLRISFIRGGTEWVLEIGVGVLETRIGSNM